MERETISIQDILERERYILCDASADRSDYDLHWTIYPAESFSRIDENLLREARERLGSFFLFLLNPNVYTTPGVIPEIEKARDIVQDKIEFLDWRRETHREHKRSRKTSLETPVQRDLLLEIQGFFHKISLQAKKSLLEPEKKELYGSLERVVLGVVSNTFSKIDYESEYGKWSKKEKTDFHTDEQLVTTALYLSLTREESGIFTGDSDIRRILINTLRYLSHPKAQNPENITEVVRENRILVYHIDTAEQAKISLDTSQLKIRKGLSLKEIESINQILSN